MSISECEKLPRHDPCLVEAVEEFIFLANYGMDVNEYPYREHKSVEILSCSILSVVEFKGNKYFIDEYDGAEELMTPEIMEKRYISIE